MCILATFYLMAYASITILDERHFTYLLDY
jgi:hypothetical protein